ncbi:MAG: anaerobic sulfatase maturase [Angelakisella sp.]
MPPINLLIKPASGLCNLRCKYCFYADEMQNREVASFGIMSLETLENVLKETFAYATGDVTIAFQGGEPTLAGLDFFRRMVELTTLHNIKKRPVHFALQTNGIVVDDEWARFFVDNRFLIGLSLDGIKDTHDLYRVDANDTGTYKTVMHTIQLFQKYKVAFNILTVITAQTASRIGKIYSFYKKSGLEYQQFIPCLDPFGEERGQRAYSLTPEKYEYFLKTQFDCWYNDIIRGHYTYNRYFENLVGMLLQRAPESCGMIGHCSKQLVIEADGSVYPCDFYVLDQYKLGNLNIDTFADIEQKRDALGFIDASKQVAEACQSCRWYPICRGGCRRDREQSDGTLGLNYYCSAYSAFFEYAISRLEKVAQLVNNGGLHKK